MGGREGAEVKVTKMFVRRKRMGLTQATLAQMVGVTQPRISAWENGKADVPEKRRAQIAEALGIAAGELTEDA